MWKSLKWGNKNQIYCISVFQQEEKKVALHSYQYISEDKDCISEPLLNCIMASQGLQY